MPTLQPTDRENLERAWGLASLPMANTHYVQAILQFVDDSHGGVDARALLMFELAIEIRMMSGDLESLLAAWRNRAMRADIAPMTPNAIKGAA